MPRHREYELYSGPKKRRGRERAEDFDSDDSSDNDGGELKPHRDTRYAKSCVKITNTFLEPDFEKPHVPPSHHSSLGSGSVIALPDKELGYKLYVLTNAHVAENHVKMYGKLSDNFAKFKLEPVVIGHDCDLALCKVNDEQYNEFVKIAEPLQFGEMVESGTKIHVNGYPIDFETPELCSTTGKVTRIKIGPYAQSGNYLLQQQVEAAINPGNSGGPVIHNGRQVGVAFQKNMMAEGFGFIIPMPVVKNFLAMALEVIQNPKQKYRGFADIEFEYQEMENEWLRKSYGMKDRTGVLLVRIDPLSSAKDLLKVDDVILAVDGHPVSNLGNVQARPSEHLKEKPLDLQFLISRKLIGDTVNFTVLRDKKELNVEVPLEHNSYETKLLGPVQHKKFPTYYIASGVEFVPATQNMFENLDELIGAFGEHGGLSSQPKKNPDDELVLVNEIFESDATEGYSFGVAPVKTINGKEIRNMRDVVKAIESNEEETHDIVLNNGYKIRVPNMTPQEQYEQILSEYGIKDYCSDELKTGKFMEVDMETEPKAKAHAPLPSWLHSITNGAPVPRSGDKKRKAQAVVAMTNDSDLSSDDEEYALDLSDSDEENMDDFIVSDDEGSELDDNTRKEIQQTIRGMFPSLSGGSNGSTSGNRGGTGRKRAAPDDNGRPSKRSRRGPRS